MLQYNGYAPRLVLKFCHCSSMSSPPSLAPELWEFPDVLLFRIVSFVAAPTFRAAVLCRQLAPLSRASYKHLLTDGGGEEKAQQRSVSLWDTVLQEDYGVAVSTDQHTRKRRRTCERLSRTPIERVRDAHRLMNSNTETAFFCLAELVRHNKSAEQRLTKARMNRIFEDYGPHLRLNRPVSSSGGVFLVEICRAKHVTERTVLSCVQELVERRGAAVNLRTCETARSRQTALCVAAVRGMASVTQYLLQRAGADPTISILGAVQPAHKQETVVAVRRRDGGGVFAGHDPSGTECGSYESRFAGSDEMSAIVGEASATTIIESTL